MKKLLVILLAFTLLCAMPVLAESYDDALDAAFEAGRAVFTQACFPLPDTATCEIVMPPDELWQFIGIEPLDEAQIRAALARSEFAVFSYAPDGGSGIGLLAAGEAALPFAISPNRLAVIWPNESRGIYDGYGQLGTVYQRFFLFRDNAAGPFGMGEAGAIWSPTGRYCCALNGMRVLQLMRVEFGAPLVVDTQSGELFALDTFGPNLMREDGGCWIDGCFAEDESAFYAMTVTGRYDETYTLVRYDLETCEATPIVGFDVNSLPSMAMMPDGKMLALIDTRRQEEAQMFARISQDGTVETQSLLLNGEFWRFRATNVRGSAESGWALLRGAFILSDAEGKGGYFGLQRLNTAGDISEEVDTVWTLLTDTQRFEALDAAHLPETAVEWVAQFINQHMQILDVALSPKGRYAAVFAAMTGEHHGETALLIVRLEDMAVLPAEGVDMGNTTAWTMGTAGGRNLMSWSEAGLLVSTSGLWQLQERN